MAPVLPPALVYKLWVVWLAVALALLIAKPWGVFSWDEWLVVAVPLLLIHAGVRPLYVFLGGLAASSLAWMFLGDQSGGWPELACLGVVLVVGTVIGFIATRDDRDGQSKLGLMDPLTNEDLFLAALNRELGRARRDEGSFAVLSVDQKEGHPDKSQRLVCEFLDAELRVYADIAQVGERVLALVPEVSDDQYEPMSKRLMARAKTSSCGEINIGLARFPLDAVCAKDLINVADRRRLVRGVSVSSSDSSESHLQALGQQMSL